MPGSGIGGLFYFCLVLWMPFNEAIQTLRGRSSAARWRTVAFHWSILLTILLVLWGEAVLLDLGVSKLSASSWGGVVIGNANAGRGMFLGVGQFAALGSLVTLGAIIVAGSIASIVLDPRLRRTPRAAR
jgi:hypothetical protein